LAHDKGIEYQLIAFRLGNWSDKTEQEHIAKLIGKGLNYLTTTKKDFIAWLNSSVAWKLCTIANTFLKQNLRLNAFAHNKRSWQISRKLRKLKYKPDLIIAHNLGALFPAFQYAKKHHIPFAFDIEDYHPGEKCSPAEKFRREFIMKKLMPKATYLTYASSLIGEYSLKLLEADHLPDKLLINNCFSEEDFQYKECSEEKLQFVWFSQNITSGRGLELVVPTLARYREKIQLTLIGNLYAGFNESFLSQYNSFICFKEPLPQKELNTSMSEYDVGLAVEISKVDINKDIALSNKIFAYAQAGLYILATDTAAQKQFIAENQLLGTLCPQTTEGMEEIISGLIENIDKIRAEKKQRFNEAKRLAWENEEKKLYLNWEKIPDK